jgi:hypothetical protein
MPEPSMKMLTKIAAIDSSLQKLSIAAIGFYEPLHDFSQPILLTGGYL